MKFTSAVFLCLLSLFAHSAEIGFGTYGNWCGLNHPADPSTAPAPIDQLDTSCQRHDQCYVDKGQFNCECDANLQKEISDALKANQYQGESKHFARTVHHYFKGSPCNGTPKSKTGPTKVIQNIFNKGKTVVGKIMPGDNKDSASKNGDNPTTAPIAPLTTTPSPATDATTPDENKSPVQDDSNG